MSRKIFVNMTAHRLSDVQREAASIFTDAVIQAEEIFPVELIQKLRQCPPDTGELMRMAVQVSDGLLEYARQEDAILYVHLPVGSPAFMWILSAVIPGYPYVIPVFSHTRRAVEETMQPDGSTLKKSVFIFEGFIFPDGGEPHE